MAPKTPQALNTQIDLTARDGDEQEAQELMVYCQHKMPGLMSGLGLRPTRVTSESVAAAL